MQRLLELRDEISQTLQGEQISANALGVTAMAQPVELTLLFGAKSSGAASEVSLFQRPSSQAPAERSPRARPGSRVR